MPQQTINIGAAPDDGTGDTLRVGGDKINDNFTELYTDKADKAGGTFTGDISVPDEAYDATAWNGSLEVPTKNAVRDKIESLGSGITELDDIPDVNAPTPANGDVLTWDSTPGEWVAAAPTGGGGVDVEDEGVSEATGATTLNFVGAGVTATDMGGGVVDVDIPGGGTASGTSFPGSPSTGDKYYRTDRNLEYVYDGTQWVTTQLFVAEVRHADGLLPFSAQVFMRGHNPWGGTYSLYIERVSISTLNGNATPASNYFTYQFSVLDGAGATNIGSLLSSQNDTQNQWFVKTATVGSVVSSTVDGFMCTTTEVGNASNYALGSVIYRLVG